MPIGQGIERAESGIEGDIKLSVFPWIALELGPASLGNPPGFGEEPFLAFNSRRGPVKLLPLLAKTAEIAGRAWMGSICGRRTRKHRQTGRTSGHAKETAPSRAAMSSADHCDACRIRVTQGRVSYQGIVVEKFNFETGAFSEHGVTHPASPSDAPAECRGENLSLRAQFD